MSIIQQLLSSPGRASGGLKQTFKKTELFPRTGGDDDESKNILILALPDGRLVVAGTDCDPIVWLDLQWLHWGLRRWAMFQTLHIIRALLIVHQHPAVTEQQYSTAQMLLKIEILKYRN